jgi:hypothetical protein
MGKIMILYEPSIIYHGMARGMTGASVLPESGRDDHHLVRHSQPRKTILGVKVGSARGCGDRRLSSSSLRPHSSIEHRLQSEILTRL